MKSKECMVEYLEKRIKDNVGACVDMHVDTIREVLGFLDPGRCFKDGEIIIEKRDSKITCICVATPDGVRYFNGTWRKWGEKGRMEYRKATNLEVLEYIDDESSFTLRSLHTLAAVLGKLGGIR